MNCKKQIASTVRRGLHNFFCSCNLSHTKEAVLVYLAEVWLDLPSLLVKTPATNMSYKSILSLRLSLVLLGAGKLCLFYCISSFSFKSGLKFGAQNTVCFLDSSLDRYWNRYKTLEVLGSHSKLLSWRKILRKMQIRLKLQTLLEEIDDIFPTFLYKT